MALDPDGSRQAAASSTTLGTPCRASSSAVTSPTGPAPTMTTGSPTTGSPTGSLPLGALTTEMLRRPDAPVKRRTALFTPGVRDPGQDVVPASARARSAAREMVSSATFRFCQPRTSALLFGSRLL